MKTAVAGPLKRELLTYKAHKPRLLRDAVGKHVLIKGGRVIPVTQ